MGGFLAALPAIISAGAGIFGSLLGGRLSGREKATLGTEDALVQDLISSAGTTRKFGEAVLPEARGGLERAQNFYQKILSGDRAAVSSAAGPEISAIGRSYAGVTRGLGEFAPRGGGTTSAAAASRFAEAGDIARTKESLFQAAPEGLARTSGALGALAEQALGLSADELRVAGGLTAEELNFLGGVSARAQQTGLAAGQGLGALLFKFLNPSTTESEPWNPPGSPPGFYSPSTSGAPFPLAPDTSGGGAPV
jgi:hypothetical protein